MSEPEQQRDVLEELARLPTLAHPTVSPDRDRVAFYYDVSGRNELHILDTGTGEHRQVSNGQVPRNAGWFVRWAADGRRVFFHLDDGGNEQNDIHAIDLETGSAEPVVEMDGQVILSDVGEDGDRLLLASSQDGQMNLYVHDIPSGGTTKITEYERAVLGGQLSPDGERVAYATNESADYDNQDVYVAGADGSEPRQLDIGETGAESTPVDWAPDGERLLVSDNTEDFTRAGVYDFAADEVTWLGDLTYEESPVAFMPGGERVLATRTCRCSTVPIVYDLHTGDGRELDLPEGVASFGGGYGAGEVALGDDRVLITLTTPTRRPELLAYDLATDEYEILVEAEYGPFEQADFADAEFLTFESDGVPETPAAAVEHDSYEEMEIEALLYDSGKRPSPLIVNPHGGPRHHDSRRFDLYTQFLVSQGYSVLQVNYRGSTGRGREFVEELYDDWGGAEQGDVAAGAEHVLAEYGWLDKQRVAVFGGSYGGYSAYWQMVQYPELYDAGIARIGVTDLFDMAENTMPHFRSELMVKYLGEPEDNEELYEERSPVTYAGNLSSPLLMIHGVNDRRVPVSQARIYRDRLEELGYEAGRGGDYEYKELGEEGHGSSDQDQKARAFRIVADFLERRLA